MRKEDVNPALTAIAFDLFYWFSRFEFALKENAYLKSRKVGAKADPGWDAFVRKWKIDGRRYLTAASVDEMTRNQLPEEVRLTVPLSAPPDRMGYGLGWAVSLDGTYFHPGTGMTDLRVDASHRIATILLMQSTAPASFAARAALLEASDRRYAAP